LISFLKAEVPFEGQGRLALLRNKTAAHYDREMIPVDMRAISFSVEVTEVAEWVSILISVLSDVLKLNVYMWSGDGYEKDSVMIMCTDPLMTDFRVEQGKIVAINNCYVSESPRWHVYSALKKVWRLSD